MEGARPGRGAARAPGRLSDWWGAAAPTLLPTMGAASRLGRAARMAAAWVLLLVLFLAAALADARKLAQQGGGGGWGAGGAARGGRAAPWADETPCPSSRPPIASSQSSTAGVGCTVGSPDDAEPSPARVARCRSAGASPLVVASAATAVLVPPGLEKQAADEGDDD